MINLFKKKIISILKNINIEIDEKIIINTAKNLVYLQNTLVNQDQNLNAYEFKVFSQFGDDGILQFLVNNLQFDNDSKNFLEFGVEDYSESNTRFLLINNNWSGIVIDSDFNNIKKIKQKDFYWRYELDAYCEFVTKENINTILEQKLGKNIGIISIDIDGNDYWVFKEIKSKPILFIIEYNSLFGFDKNLTIPYKKNFNRNSEHYSNLYWGCSLNALIQEAKNKDYQFIGTNLAGNNSYFVRQDKYFLIKDKIVNFSKNISKFRESRDINGKKNFLNKKQQINLISNLDLYDIDINKIVKIKDLFNLEKKKI